MYCEICIVNKHDLYNYIKTNCKLNIVICLRTGVPTFTHNLENEECDNLCQIHREWGETICVKMGEQPDLRSMQYKIVSLSLVLRAGSDCYI